MKKVTTLLASSLLFISVAGCDTLNNQDVGVMTGGVIGGVLGNQIGGGGGRIAATIGGTILGAYLGGQVGRNMDEVDRMKMSSALETAPTNRSISWQNPDSGAAYVVVPTRTYYQRGLPCRDYTTTAIIGGKREVINGRACRNSDGSWQAMN